jgi:hypothetical protein
LNIIKHFKAELKKITVEKLAHERARTQFYGKLNDEGFLIQAIFKHYNFWRPAIVGRYDNEAKIVNVKLGIHKRDLLF